MNKCEVCSKEFVRKTNTTGRYCSAQCYYSIPKPKGPNHPSWKGGRYLQDGYIRIHFGDGKQVLEHRLVMEKILGRPMLATETVHHKNGIRHDNRPENLELRVGQHGKGATHHCPTCTCDKT